MELKLSAKEVEEILIEWSAGKFGNSQFDTIEFDASYSYLRCATLSKSEPVEPKAES